MNEVGASVKSWIDVVRRARIGKTVKGIALVLASFADYRTGRDIFPSLAKVAVAAEVDYKTAKRALAALTAAGLIEKVNGHTGARGNYDEYRLILAPDVLERIDVLTPTQYENEVQRVREANSRKAKPRDVRGATDPVPGEVPEGDLRGAGDPVPADPPQDRTGYSTSESDEVRGTGSPEYGVPESGVPPIDLPVTDTSHNSGDLRTEVTAPRARARDEDPDPIPAPRRCPHGLGSGHRTDGAPECPLCRLGLPPSTPNQTDPADDGRAWVRSRQATVVPLRRSA